MSLDDILKCSGCSDQLTSPQTLTCFHTFCPPCSDELCSDRQLDDHGNSGIVCPICNVFTKDADISLSKPFLERCLEIDALRRRLEEDGAELKCHQCQTSHRDMSDFAHHRIASVEESPIHLLASMPVYCDEHPRQELVWHCVHCEEALCEQCKEEKHDTHQTEDIAQAVKKILPEVRYRMQNYQRRIKQLGQVLPSYDMESMKLKKNLTNVKKHLEDHKNIMIAKVESDYQILMKKLNDQSKGLSNDLEMRKSWVHKELKHQESIVSWVGNVTNLTSGACLFKELQSSIMKAVQESDRNLSLDKLHCQLPFLSFSPLMKISRVDNLLGDLSFSTLPPPSSRLKSDPPSRDSPVTVVTPAQRPVQLHSEMPFRHSQVTKLDAILDEEEPAPRTVSGGDYNRDGSPSSIASTPSTKAGKGGNKQVSFLRTLVTPLEEDEETDGRISRASNDRLSRASVNIPIMTQNGKKKSFGQYNYAKKKRVKESSLERSPARSVQEDSRRYDLTPTSSERSFRCIISSNFSDLTSVICKPTGEFKIKNFHNRMCFVDDEIWMLLTEENSMALYSTEGTLLKEKLQLANVERPHALHPLNAYHVLIACENGLFILHGSTMNTSQVIKGKFCDVCVDKTTAVALEFKQGKIYVLDFSTKPVQKSSFRTPLTLANMYKEESKLVLCDGVIFLSIYNDEPILQYDLKGNLIGQFGQWGKGAAGNMGSPRVCSVDNRGNLLVADFANNRLQVMHPGEKWSVLLTHVKHPKDAVVMDNGMLYILTDDHKVFSFRAEKHK